jgi:4-hydroxythreonine-4-phosphate dehydrogenase
MGDPGGVGAEVALKAIANRSAGKAVPILVGDMRVWQQTARRLRPSVRLRDWEAPARKGNVRVLQTSALAERDCTPGKPRTRRSAAARGEAAFAAIVAAVRLVGSGQAAGVVTGPIAKAHLAAAGHDYPGHTELLAHLCGDVPVRMMMAGSRLRVVLVTTHVALAEVPQRLTRAAVLETILITERGLRQHFRLQRPRIAVAGLNPHAGEDGLFGNEERRVIAPAVRAAQRRGIDVRGPVAADSAFPQAAAGRDDAIVCMYHDQGLAPFKLLHFADGVNFTLGLPFVRTSPDHGTAFDIAGSGRADPRSMTAALRLAEACVGPTALPLEKRSAGAVS